jgi:tripartite motif-containing protein 71
MNRALLPDQQFIYVADTDNNRIQKFDSAGNFLDMWGSFGFGQGQFKHPLKVAVDPTGDYVDVADSQNDRVQKFTINVTFVTKWGSNCDMASGKGCTSPTGNLSLGDGQFKGVEGISVDPLGTFIYVLDSRNNRVQVFTPKAAFGNTISLSHETGLPTLQSDHP